MRTRALIIASLAALLSGCATVPTTTRSTTPARHHQKHRASQPSADCAPIVVAAPSTKRDDRILPTFGRTDRPTNSERAADVAVFEQGDEAMRRITEGCQ